jgi:hypothetical protein
VKWGRAVEIWPSKLRHPKPYQSSIQHREYTKLLPRDQKQPIICQSCAVYVATLYACLVWCVGFPGARSLAHHDVSVRISLILWSGCRARRGKNRGVRRDYVLASPWNGFEATSGAECSLVKWGRAVEIWPSKLRHPKPYQSSIQHREYTKLLPRDQKQPIICQCCAVYVATLYACLVWCVGFPVPPGARSLAHHDVSVRISLILWSGCRARRGKNRGVRRDYVLASPWNGFEATSGAGVHLCSGGRGGDLAGLLQVFLRR